MSRDDRPTDPPGGDDLGDEDPDRAAILARRRRFIAVALSGLAVGAGCPQPCLSMSPPQDADKPQPDEPAGKPEACLKVAPPAEPNPTPVEPVPPPTEPTPQPCLKVAAPPTEPEPAPCLRVAPPKEPAPQSCLKVHKPSNEGKPRPCLKIARPEPDGE
jgi:hypothetical protein